MINLTIERELPHDQFELEFLIKSINFPQNSFDVVTKIRRFCLEFSESNNFEYFSPYHKHISNFIRRNYLEHEKHLSPNEKNHQIEIKQKSTLKIKNLSCDSKCALFRKTVVSKLKLVYKYH